MTTHPTDDLAAFAIGALDERENDAIGAHLRDCGPCRAEVEEYERAMWRLADSVAQEPPASMRRAVLERARATRPMSRGIVAPLADLFRRPVPLFVPAALAVVVAVAAVGYAGARRDADRYAAALTAVGNARVVALSPSAEQPGARGALVVPSNGSSPYLILDLPQPQAGKTWQAWVIRGTGAPVPAGTSGDVELIYLTVPLQAGDVLAVTLENAGGASKPSTTPVLTGKTS